MKFDFTDNEIKYIYDLTKIDASVEINTNQVNKIYNAVGHECIFKGFDKNDMPTELAIFCEQILDKIADQRTDVVNIDDLNFE